MNYWLCITNEENWNVIKAENIWGVSEGHKNQLSKVEIGDFLVFYLKQEKIGDRVLPSRISGIFKVTSESFKDKKGIFSPIGFGDELFPYRVRLEPVIIPRESIEFKPLIQSLKFIKNKKKWWGHIQGKALRTIPEEDFELIRSKIRE